MQANKVQQSRADPTRANILQHARKLFTKHGFAATSMSMIATQANINRSLIFHHFENKQNLWVVVKQDIVARATKRAAILPDMSLPWRDYLNQWLNNNIAFYRNNPDIIAMINWQRTEHAKADYIGSVQSTESKRWTVTLKHFQQQGDIGQHVDVGFAITLIASISSSAALDPNIFIKKKNDLQSYLEFCTELIIKGLK